MYYANYPPQQHAPPPHYARGPHVPHAQDQPRHKPSAEDNRTAGVVKYAPNKIHLTMFTSPSPDRSPSKEEEESLVTQHSNQDILHSSFFCCTLFFSVLFLFFLLIPTTTPPSCTMPVPHAGQWQLFVYITLSLLVTQTIRISDGHCQFLGNSKFISPVKNKPHTSVMKLFHVFRRPEQMQLQIRCNLR